MTFLDSIGIGLIVAILQYTINPDNNTGFSVLNKVNQILDNFGIQSISFSNLLLISILMFVLKGLLSFIQMYLQALLTSQILSKTRRSLIDDITDMKYTGFIAADAGTIQNISTLEVNRLNNALHSYLNTLQYIVMSICYIIIAIVADYKFASMVLVCTVSLLYFYNYIIKYFKQLSTRISIKGNLYNSYLSQLLQNFKYLKSTNTIFNYRKKVIHEINETERLSLKFWKINAFTNSVREPLILLIVSLVIIIQYNLTGQINTFIIYSLLLFYRTLNFILLAQSNWQSFTQFSGSIDNIMKTQAVLKESKEFTNAIEFKSFNNEIKFRGVDININEYQILHDLDLDIHKNTMVALVGKSGAGKSTLASVISGLIPPAKGSIMIDDRELADYNINTYRNKVGYVSQDPVVFNDSFYNNITLWCDKDPANLEQFNSIVDLTQLRNLISHHPKKEDTIVGDNGIILSGGQKQRIAIARELFRKTEIIILDEATSSLDSETESIIQSNLDSLAGKTTLVVIAHRLSTIKNADQIILLNKGRIDQTGSFEELNRTSELFNKMVRLQNY